MNNDQHSVAPARACAAARAWLAATFRGLTARRFALYCAVVGVIALIDHPTITMLRRATTALDVVLAVGRPFVYMMLVFTPVLLAVLAVENRGRAGGWRRVLRLCVAVVVGHAVGSVLWAISVPLLYPPHGFLQDWLRRVPTLADNVRFFGGRGLMLMLISAIAVALYYFFQRSAEVEQAQHEETVARENVDREGTEARLALMQAQVEPHFLFNTLASVRRLYQTDKAAGRTMLMHLTSYLTASLPAMRSMQSTLGREIVLATAYLNVQRIRMEARLTFDVDVPNHLAGVIVPPMMLATLVENAIIHGLSPLPQGGHITIRARENGERLLLEVVDNGRGLTETTWGGGVGLANIRARLTSAFGNEATLVLAPREEGGVTATIDLPLARMVARVAA